MMIVRLIMETHSCISRQDDWERSCKDPCITGIDTWNPKDKNREHDKITITIII